MSLHKVQLIQEAIRRVEQGESLRSVAKAVGVPRSTIQDRINKKVPVNHVGTTELTAEEELRLKVWIKGMAERGFGRTRLTVCREVKRVLDVVERTTRFKQNLPGKDWYYAFLKRHPDLVFRTPMQLSKQRAMVAPGMIFNWFSDCENFIKQHVTDWEQLFNDPSRWYNADETGFPLCPKSGKVLCTRDQQNLYQFTTSDKSVITVLACHSASGAYVPPMIVFAGTGFAYDPLEGFPEAAFGLSVSGWMDSDLFFHWLKNVFIPHLDEKNVSRPVMLMVDGHKTHLTLEASDACLENGIHLYCLLENSTHLIQPCDLRLFSVLKNAWRVAVSEWQDSHPGEIPHKRTFASIFRVAWVKSATENLAIMGFEETGLHPWNPEHVANSKKLKPCQLFQLPSQTASATSISTEHPFKAQTLDRMSNTVAALDLASIPVECSCTCKCGRKHKMVNDTSAPDTTTSPAVAAVPIRPNAFDILTFPQVTMPPKSNRSTEKVPKAVTGPEFRAFLQQKREKKEQEEREREERKLQRMERKRKADEEKTRKMEEREQKKKNAEEKKKEADQKKKEADQKKREEREKKKSEMEAKKQRRMELEMQMTQEMENSNDDIPTGPIDINICYKCDGKFSSREAAKWIGCNQCPRWFHQSCIDIDLSSLTEEEIEASFFECNFC